MLRRSLSQRFALMDRGSGKRLGILAIALSLGLTVLWFLIIWMPGQSYSGKLPELTAEEINLRQTLEADIVALASASRSDPDSLETAAQYIEQRFSQAGLPLLEGALFGLGSILI